jgi:hypothetical protein
MERYAQRRRSIASTACGATMAGRAQFPNGRSAGRPPDQHGGDRGSWTRRLALISCPRPTEAVIDDDVRGEQVDREPAPIATRPPPESGRRPRAAPDREVGPQRRRLTNSTSVFIRIAAEGHVTTPQAVREGLLPVRLASIQVNPARRPGTVRPEKNERLAEARRSMRLVFRSPRQR